MKNRLIIKNGTVIFHNRIQEETTIVCENGKIIDIVESVEVAVNEGDLVIDAKGIGAVNFTNQITKFTAPSATVWQELIYSTTSG